MLFTTLGLAAITIAWLTQLVESWVHHDRVLRVHFMILYGLGTILILIDAMSALNGQTFGMFVWFQIIILLLVLLNIMVTRD